MQQSDVDALRNAENGTKALKLVLELAQRVEALEQRGSFPAAPTSASEIPDVNPEQSEPIKKKKKSADTSEESN